MADSNRNSKGQFAKGNQCAVGRRQGILGKYSVYRKHAEEYAEPIIRRLVQLAVQEGNTAAAALLLARLWPVGHEQELELRSEIEELKKQIEELLQKRAA